MTKKRWIVGKYDNRIVWVSGTFTTTAQAALRSLDYVRQKDAADCRYTIVSSNTRPQTQPKGELKP